MSRRRAADETSVRETVEGSIEQTGVAAKPLANRQVKAALRQVEVARRYPVRHQPSQHQFPLVAGNVTLQVGIEGKGELHQTVIQEWRPDLERVRHGRAIDLGQHRVGKVGVEVRPLHTADGVEILSPMGAKVPEIVFVGMFQPRPDEGATLAYLASPVAPLR